MHEQRRVTLTELIQQANKAWHGVRLGRPDWSGSSHSLALTVELRAARRLGHLMFNAYWEPLEFELPPVAAHRADPWRRWIDTALESPSDIVPWETAPSTPGDTYRVEARSVVVLLADLG